MKFQRLNFVITIINIIITKVPATTTVIIFIILNITPVHITNFTTNEQPRLALLLLLSLGRSPSTCTISQSLPSSCHLTLHITSNNVIIRITNVVITVSPVIVIPTTVFTTTSSITSFYKRLSPHCLEFYITHGCHHSESHHEQVPPGLVLFHPVCSNRKGSGLGEARGNSPLILLEESDHSQRGLLSPWTTLRGSSQLPWGVLSHVGKDGFCATPEKKVFNPRKEIGVIQLQSSDCTKEGRIKC